MEANQETGDGETAKDRKRNHGGLAGFIPTFKKRVPLMTLPES